MEQARPAFCLILAGLGPESTVQGWGTGNTPRSTIEGIGPLMTASELRNLMNDTGWTQGDLARLLPLRTPKSTRIIRYWLSGTHPIRPVIAARIRSLVADVGPKP